MDEHLCAGNLNYLQSPAARIGQPVPQTPIAAMLDSVNCLELLLANRVRCFLVLAPIIWPLISVQSDAPSEVLQKFFTAANPTLSETIPQLIASLTGRPKFTIFDYSFQTQ